jgi:predicted DNA-binding transcriptional regulator AlpA
MPADPIDPSQIVGSAEIAKRLGVRRETVLLWRRRHEDFPKPIAELEQALVWSWPDVEDWARATGRLS